MEELAIKGEAMEQEIMPSFDFLLEGERKRMRFWQSIVPG